MIDGGQTSTTASRQLGLRARLDYLIGRRRRDVVALALLSLFASVVEAATLALIAQLAAALVKGEHHLAVRGVSFHAGIPTLIAVAGVLCLVRMALQLPLSIVPARIGSEVQAELRRKLFHAFTQASWSEQARDREGQLQETMTSQVIQASAATLQATALITTSLTFLVLLSTAFLLNAVAAVAVMVTSAAILALLHPLRQMGVRYARALSRSQLRYAGAVAESVRLAQETRVFGVGEAQCRRLDVYIENARRLAFRVQVLFKLMSSLYQSAIYLVLVGALAAFYLAGSHHAGSLGAVVLLLVRAGTSGQQLASNYQGLSQSLPFVERVQEAARRYLDSMPAHGTRPLGQVHTLSFHGVSYAYRADRAALTDVSFDVAEREAVGIIGPSGAGKSTLIQLLLALRAPDEGEYLINNVPALEYSARDWHRVFSYVPQEPRLLHASVADNIRYFRPLDEEAVQRAGRLARIHDDVMSWPDGYATIVGPRADAVSGGQQQRICLARALAGRPSVLVLDEPTSALDPHSEILIQDSLSALRDELTLFIIAHRMSTLDICKRVMVVIDGRLAAFASKDELQHANSYYRSASLIAAGSGAGIS